MNIRILPPQQNLIELIASELAGFQPDLARFWVVFPERRPAYYLYKALFKNIGHGYIPPRIDSFDDFVDHLYAEKFGLKDKKAACLEAVGILYQIHRENPTPFAGQAFLKFDEFFSLGLKIYHDLEDLMQARVKPEALREADLLVQQNFPPETASRLQSLSFFYERFYDELKALGLLTPAARLSFVVDHFLAEALQNESFIIAGFFSLTRNEAELIKKLLNLPKTTLYLMAGRGLEALANILDIRLEEKETRSAPGDANNGSQGEWKFFMAPDTHGEIFALNQELESKLKQPDRLNVKQVIVLPAAETLFPLYHQTLASLPPESFNISLGYPLTRTPLFSFFDSLFNLIQTVDEAGRFYLPEYLRFVLHPYTKNIYFPGPPRRADLTRILFHLIEETLTREKGKLFASLEEIENNPRLAEALNRYVLSDPESPEAEKLLGHLKGIHEKTIIPFMELKNLKDFAQKLARLIEYIGNESTASRHVFFEPYVRAFLDQFAALEESFVSSQSFDQLSSYFNLFRKIISEASVPFPGTPLQGLQVLGFWETRCLQFKEVYLLDMNEGIIPATAKADSVLPYMVRKVYGLPTYEDLERRIEYYLDVLIRGASKVSFYFVENSEKEKSRLVERLIWEKQKRENEPNPSKFIHTVRYQVALSSAEPKTIAKSEAVLDYLRKFRFSASSLDAYLACPLNFYYSFVLNLEEKEEITAVPEKKEIGILVHAILERFFRRWVGKPIDPEKLSETQLKQAVAEEFASKFGQDLSGSAYLIKQQVEAHLLDFLRHYQLPMIKKLALQGKHLYLLGLEEKLEDTIEVDGTLFRLVAHVDRVEKRGDRIYIVDYKTSAKKKPYEVRLDKLQLEARSTWAEAVGSLQLPLYNFLWASKHKRPPEEIFAVLLLLGKNYLSEDIEYLPFAEEREERREALQTMLSLVKAILLEIINPAIPFSSELAKEDSCRFCPYTSLCGLEK